MSVLLKRARLPRSGNWLLKTSLLRRNESFASTTRGKMSSRAIIKTGLIGISIGVPVGLAVAAGYSWYLNRQSVQNDALLGNEIKIVPLKAKPQISTSRKIISPTDTTGLKLTLFQYQTCPFCCKVRVLLDYYGISYDVVEVDPVLRNEISWSGYKKVPILLTKTESGYMPLTESSMIVSLLVSYLQDRSQSIEEIAEFYPNIAMYDESEKFQYEIMNKYYLMYRAIPAHRSLNDIVEERKWRKWTDDVLVHTLSPNVYRTLDEAYQTFNWFSAVGKWDEYFPAWERFIMVNIGATAMWMIAKRLKKRHGLKGDVRQSLYDEINNWLRAVKSRGGTFMGGDKPDLSDLAVYGVLKSIEGCEAFSDVLKNTNIRGWYEAMLKEVEAHSGSKYLAS